MKKPPRISVRPATRDRWKDLEVVFGMQGAYSGCWCMYWRVKRKEFDAMGAKGRKEGLKKLTRRKRPPGILFYNGPAPFAWCSLGPREDFPPLARSYITKPVDDAPVWSMVCFYVREEYQGRGLFRRLVSLAADYARSQGAAYLEAYPREKRYAGVEAYMGIADAFFELGFREIARRKSDRPVVRLAL
jgi:GNAT superfamily N-acetyltransferase